MSFYKYMSADGGLRFLRTLELRITPPAEFNDPFELRAPARQVFTEAYVNKEFAEAVPEMILTDLTRQLTPAFSAFLDASEINDLVACLISSGDTALRQKVLTSIVPKVPALAGDRFVMLQSAFRQQFPAMMEQARRMTSTVLPTFNAALQKSLLNAPSMLGVLCLSRNSNQPLMWAHYAESHRGLMIEFDGSHATFNRKRSAVDDFGYLRPVVYSDVRPELSMDTFDGDTAFEVFALTKSRHWSYEEESRLIWPLRSADRTLDTPEGSVSLISCPSTSLLSITLGCKATTGTLESVHQAVEAMGTGHISIRRAQLDDVAYDLTYRSA